MVKNLAINNNMIIETLDMPDPDQTIEVLMTDLDPKVMAIFTKEDSVDAKEATQVSWVTNNYLQLSVTKSFVHS